MGVLGWRAAANRYARCSSSTADYNDPDFQKRVKIAADQWDAFYRSSECEDAKQMLEAKQQFVTIGAYASCGDNFTASLFSSRGVVWIASNVRGRFIGDREPHLVIYDWLAGAKGRKPEKFMEWFRGELDRIATEDTEK